MSTSNRLLRTQSGFGLVEVLVVILIMLFMSLAIFSVLANSEGNKRSTTSVNDIDQAGGFSIYELDKAIRNGGAGYRQAMSTTYGCQINAELNNKQILPTAGTGAGVPAQFSQLDTLLNGNYRMIPTLIVAGGSNLPGARASVGLVTASGNWGFGEFPVTVTAQAAAVTATGANLSMQSTVGLRANDIVMIANPVAGANVSPCMISEISAGWPAASQGVVSVLPLGGDYYFQNNANTTMVTAGAAGGVTNLLDLGNEFADGAPSVKMFVVAQNGSDSTLYSYDLLQVNSSVPATTPQEVADGVYVMQAIYGISAPAATCTPTSTVSCPIVQWVSAATPPWDYATLNNGTLASADAIYQIKAIRLGFILRTSLPEKNQVTLNPVTLFNDLTPAYGAPYVYNFTAAESYYRYRTVESTIPVRNNIFP